MTAEITVAARAKVNLTLHVTGRRADGYHLLESVVVFPDVGDTVTVSADDGLSLAVEGPFATALAGEGDNLVLRAARALQARIGRGGARIVLHKALPVASGIGGGSADAAATLHALARLWEAPPDVLPDLALPLGADVPVCLYGQPAQMTGIGEVLTPLPPLPGFWLLLVNPGEAVPTRAVFAALTGFGAPAGQVPEGMGLAGFTDWIAAQRNDLQPAALQICPVIGTVLARIERCAGVRLARMSGSGATCFGLFAAGDAARAAAREIAREHPGWWCAAGWVPPRSEKAFGGRGGKDL